MSITTSERAIIFGSTVGTYFVASAYDELILRKNNLKQEYSVGDCIEITEISYTGWSLPNGVRERKRVVEQCQKIEPFVEWFHKNKNGICVSSNIVGVSYCPHPNTSKIVRCFRTSFLREVYDSEVSRTQSYSDEELMRMKVVASHVVSAQKNGFWATAEVVGCDNNSNSEKNDRTRLKAIALEVTEYFSKNKRHDIYFWIPYRTEQILFTEELRGKTPKMRFHGNWVTFTVNKMNRIDSLSDVQIIDDFLSTRFYSKHYEVRVPIRFDAGNWDRKSYPELTSDHCHLVADVTGTLENYNRLSSFSDEAWVRYFPHEPARNIRFILSDKQEEWRDNSRNSRSDNVCYDEERSRDYGYQDRNIEEFSKNSSENHFRSSNKFSYETEDNATSSRGRGEVKNETSQERRSRSGMSVRKYESRNDEEHGTRESSKLFDDEEDRQPGPSRSRAQRDQSVENRRNVPPRSDRSPSSKRDDISVKSVGDPSNSNLRKLKKRYEYLMANDMNIPEKLLEDLKNALIEDQESAKKKNVDYSDFEDSESGISGIREKRELAKIEVNEEELKTYKELVILFREMLSSPRVCEEMQRFDSKAMREINRLLLDL